MNVRLDERLLACGEFARLDKIICDVGTDHALLPCWLIQQGAVSVIASDINDGPLLSAKETIAQYGCGGITLVKSDGLKNIPFAEDVIIAGMGGELIGRILSECTFLSDDFRCILQPMTKAEELRRSMYGNGFEIITERTAHAHGKCYTVIHGRFTGKRAEIDDETAFFGKNADRAYIEKQLAALDKMGLGSEKYRLLAEKVRQRLH